MVNIIMRGGKKQTARKLLWDAMRIIREQGEDPQLVRSHTLPPPDVRVLTPQGSHRRGCVVRGAAGLLGGHRERASHDGDAHDAPSRPSALPDHTTTGRRPGDEGAPMPPGGKRRGRRGRRATQSPYSALPHTERGARELRVRHGLAMTRHAAPTCRSGSSRPPRRGGRARRMGRARSRSACFRS